MAFPDEAPRVQSEQVRAGVPLRLAVDPGQISCVDPTSGENLALTAAVSGVSAA